MTNTSANDSEWSLIIEPRQSDYRLNLKETFRFKDLLFLFVKRDFIMFYKQTILGPLWFVIQPALRVITYYIIFGRIANLSTDGVPPILFYLCGVTFWEFFSTTWKNTSETFSANQGIFGKVYFPRLVTPLSILLSNSIKLGIQFLLFAAVYTIFALNGMHINIQSTIWLLPVLILMIAVLALGCGLIITSLTTKYRDIKFLLDTLIQLLMYATPIIYPLSIATGKFRLLLLANPLTGIIEAIKYSFFGQGTFSLLYLSYSLAFAVIILFVGIIIFNRSERNFMDTV